MVDLVEKERAIREFQAGVEGRLLRHFKAWGPVIALCVIAYCGYALGGARVEAITSGRIAGLRVHAQTDIYRDDRGIPHIRARNLHDAFFAEGFVQASDRLFQMDLLRRYVYGELAEMLGPIQLGTDEAMRTLDARDIVTREWRHLSAGDRAALQAYSDGVNASMQYQPVPIEFRLLLYAPRAWTPRDCLAVTLAISASVGDTPGNILERDSLWRSLTSTQFAQVLPLSDPQYDVPAAPRGHDDAPGAQPHVAWIPHYHISLNGIGSNAWAAGGAHTLGGHALIANDPHMNVSIPGIWYIVEMRAPGLHVAGVTIPGIPGVVLGHNDRIAWATTNAMATTSSMFEAHKLNRRNWKREVFRVRFSRDAVKGYYRTAREFGVPAPTVNGVALVRWAPYSDTRSAVSTVLLLDRAQDVRQALRALSRYAGPPQNFLIAGPAGEVAYHLAGPIPNDPAWSRYVHRWSELRDSFPAISYSRLPSVKPSRNAVVLSANNKMYGEGYAYRLSPMFAPPYRAYRIASLLHARTRYDAGYFARMQRDTSSPADAEFAHRLAAYVRTHNNVLPSTVAHRLAQWNGDFSPDSQVATLAHSLRLAAEDISPSPYAVLEGLRRRDPPDELIDAIRDPFMSVGRVPCWSDAGAINVFHPFGPIGFPFLNGMTLPGSGDEYTIHVQSAGLAQSFRAVWEVGAWERGGLSIPSGESGEIGSAHYNDLSASWIRGELQPLPFSDASVARSSRTLLSLASNH